MIYLRQTASKIYKIKSKKRHRKPTRKEKKNFPKETKFIEGEKTNVVYEQQPPIQERKKKKKSH